MLTNKTRIWRMLGAITVILIGISAGTIEDTQAAAIFMWASILIALITLLPDVASLTSNKTE